MIEHEQFCKVCSSSSAKQRQVCLMSLVKSRNGPLEGNFCWKGHLNKCVVLESESFHWHPSGYNFDLSDAFVRIHEISIQWQQCLPIWCILIGEVSPQNINFPLPPMCHAFSDKSMIHSHDEFLSLKIALIVVLFSPIISSWGGLNVCNPSGVQGYQASRETAAAKSVGAAHWHCYVCCQIYFRGIGSVATK